MWDAANLISGLLGAVFGPGITLVVFLTNRADALPVARDGDRG